MSETFHGRVHGRTIELDRDPGVADGQIVEVQVNVVQPAEAADVGAAMKEIYKVLGERYESGHTDTAERHNEHQP